MNVVINQENPGVLNPAYFANITNEVYDQTILGIAHRISNIVAFTLGMISVSLVLFCVCRKTPDYLKPYARMLCFCAFTDGTLILVDFCCQTRIKMSHGFILVSFTGPAKLLPYKWQCLFMAPQEMVPILGIAILPVQYIYRYYTISRKQSPTLIQTCGLFAIAFILSLLTAMWVAIAYLRIYDQNPPIDYSKYWFVEAQIPQLLVFGLTDHFILFMLLAIALLSATSYILILIFARRTFLLTVNVTMSKRTLKQSRQLSRILLIQSIIPLISSFFPVICVILTTVVDVDTGHLGEVIIFVISWFPVMNSMSNFGIAPYRLFLKRLFYRVFGLTNKVEAFTSISGSTNLRLNHLPTLSHTQTRES